jgi:hypothetical protein
MVDRIKDSLAETTALVRTKQKKSGIFKTEDGTPQGSALSPQLFIGTMGHVAVREMERRGFKNHGEYADDLNIVLKNLSEVPASMMHLRQSMSLIGLELEASKTEILQVKDKFISFFNVRNTERVEKLNEVNVFNVDMEEFLVKDDSKSIRYLGTQLGSKMIAMRSRIAMANNKFNQLYHAVWNRANLTLKTKMKVFNAVVMSTLLYALKCHSFTRREMKSLDNFCLRKLKCLLNYNFDAKVSYNRVDADMSVFNTNWKWPKQRLQEQRLEYFVESIKNPDFLDIIVPTRGLKRSRGRPKFRLIDAIKDDLEDIAKIDYTRMENILNFDSKISKAEKIITICQLWEIDKNQNTV